MATSQWSEHHGIITIPNLTGTSKSTVVTTRVCPSIFWLPAQAKAKAESLGAAMADDSQRLTQLALRVSHPKGSKDLDYWWDQLLDFFFVLNVLLLLHWATCCCCCMFDSLIICHYVVNLILIGTVYQNRSQIVVDPKDLYRIKLYGGLQCAKNHFGIPSLTTFSVGAVHRRITKEKSDVNSTPGGWCEFPQFSQRTIPSQKWCNSWNFHHWFHGLVVIICHQLSQTCFFQEVSRNPPTFFVKNEVSSWSQLSWGSV